MWTGSPEATASVAKIRRKSCGVEPGRCPVGVVRPLAVTMRWGVTCGSGMTSPVVGRCRRRSRDE